MARVSSRNNDNRDVQAGPTVPFDETIRAIDALNPALKIGAAGVIAYLLHRRLNAPNSPVRLEELRTVVESMKKTDAAEQLSLERIVASIRSSRIPGVSLHIGRRLAEPSLTLGNGRGRTSHTLLPELVRNFPYLKHVIENAERVLPQVCAANEKPPKLSVADEITALIIEKPGVALGSRLEGHTLRATTNHVVIAAALRHLVPNLALHDELGSYYRLTRGREPRKEIVFYTRVPEEVPVLPVGSVLTFPALNGDEIDLMVSHLYPNADFVTSVL